MGPGRPGAAQRLHSRRRQARRRQFTPSRFVPSSLGPSLSYKRFPHPHQDYLATDFLSVSDLCFHRGRKRRLGFPFSLWCLFSGTSHRGPEAQHFLRVLKCHLLGEFIGHQPRHFSQVFRFHPSDMSNALSQVLICLILSVCSETG